MPTKSSVSRRRHGSLESPAQSRETASRPALEPSARQAVEEAARVVLENPEEWRWYALHPDEAEDTLERLTDMITGEWSRGSAPDRCASVAALALRLSHLIREELLRDPRGLSDAMLIDVVRRIEECRVRIEPDSRQELSFLLTGANAMELVVEFAHDLRSPLTSIMFLSDTLRKGQSGEINDVQRQQLGIMYSAALGMVNVANDLMDLARSDVDEAWEESIEEPFSLQELVENTRNMVAPMAEHKRLAISFMTPQHDVRIGHPVLLSRVLLNLLTNALKFTEEGRVEILVEEQPAERVLFSVHDTGRGMSEDQLESIYNLFGRSESATGYHFSGTGLGLSICRRLVDLMGGELHVESERGKGSRFYFELPMPRASSS